MNPVQIFFGAEGIKQVYGLSLKAKNIDIVCFSNQYDRIIGDYFDSNYSPKLYGDLRIKTREILPDTKKNRQAAERKDKQKNQVKFIKLPQKSESDYILFNNKAALISYNQKSPFVCLVTDSDLVTNLKVQFENLWKRL